MLSQTTQLRVVFLLSRVITEPLCDSPQLFLLEAYNSAKVAVMFVNKGKPDDQKKPMPEPSDTLTAMHAIFREYVAMFEKRMGYSAAHHSGDWGYVPKASLSHYASLDEVGATEVSKIVWLRQEPDQLVQQLREAERRWQERETNRFVNSSPDDIVVHTFPNGFQWVLLNRPSCSEEGEAMGHCGNAGAKAGDRILSLRRIEKKGKSKGLRPHLTFVLHKNGALGEMKARFNKKPTPNYHPYIIELLKNPIIKKIEGGGYLPQNNFSLDDLPDNLRDEIISYKKW